MKPIGRLVLACVCVVAASRAAVVNLALRGSGGTPSALATTPPDLTYSAQKACDGNEQTGWVSLSGALPVWLRVEWPFPVEVQEVALRQFAPAGFKDVGPLGAYTIETQGRDGTWQAVAAGNAARAASTFSAAACRLGAFALASARGWSNVCGSADAGVAIAAPTSRAGSQRLGDMLRTPR